MQGVILDKIELLQEYGKCATNPAYAIQKYLKTFDNTQQGFVPFMLFPRQKEVLKSFRTHRYNIINKYRQSGISTTTAAYCSTMVQFADEEKPEKILILANKLDIAKEMLKKIKGFLDQYPAWMNDGLDPKKRYAKDSQQHLIFHNGCEIKALATSLDALRGFTPTLLIIDEAAFVDGGEALWAACQAALSTGGKATLISTPSGLDPIFYKNWEGAITKRNSFHATLLWWYEDPRYSKGLVWRKKGHEDKRDIPMSQYADLVRDGWDPTSPWFEGQCKQLNYNDKLIAQEFKCSFLGSGGLVIGEEYIMAQEKKYIQEPIRMEGYDRNVWIWKDPEVGHQYIMGVDVSTGQSDDYSTFCIVDMTTGEQVAEYNAKIPPDKLGEIVYEYGNRYQAHTAVDVTGGVGITTIIKLLDLNYQFLHYDDFRNPMLSGNARIAGAGRVDGKLPGFYIGSSNRPLIIQELEGQIRREEVMIRSTRTLSELKTFVYKGDRPDHMTGYHDDNIFALAIALYVVQNSFKNLQRFNEMTKAMLGAWSVQDATVPIQKQIDQIRPGNMTDMLGGRKQDPSLQYRWLLG